MKRLIMCEGPNELAIINILLENDALIFNEDELLGLTAYHARQISSSSQVKTALSLYPGNDVLVMRIGDRQSDQLRIPDEFKAKIQGIEKYCTLPELEMLLIISEALVDEFEKTKSTVRAKDFAKMHIRCGKKMYDNSSKFFWDYYGDNCSKLKDAIIEYRRYRKSHAKNELYLSALLK